MSAKTADRIESDEIPPPLTECPNPRGISTRAVWYYLPEFPEFLICSFCYERHIKSTEFASRLSGGWSQAGSTETCRWNTSRIMSYVENGDWKSIMSFLKRRAKISDCKGAAGHTGPDGSRWYMLQDPSVVSDMAVCEACYEDLIAWNGLRGYFSTLPSTKMDDDTCTCDASLPFVWEWLKRNVTSTDEAWDRFMSWVKQRLEFPACREIKESPAGSTWWFSCKDIPDFQICGACWMDRMALDYPHDWERISLTEDEEEDCMVGACDMANLPMLMAWNRVEKTQDYDGFKMLAGKILDSPGCSAEGIEGATWYTPSEYLGNQFAICERCLIAFMLPANFHTQFRELDGPSDGSAYVCDLNLSKPRWQAYVAKYEEAVDQNEFSIFSDYVSHFASIPGCPRTEAWTNRKWYGTSDFTACELCYDEAIKGTSLADQLTCEIVRGDAMCHLYSPRMRRLWNQACAEDDLEQFNAIARERLEVFSYKEMREQSIQAQQQIRSQQQHTLFMTSIMNQGSNNLTSIFNPHPENTWGNSTVGYGYTTSAGVDAAMQFRQATSIRVVQSGDITELNQLIQLWAEVE